MSNPTQPVFVVWFVDSRNSVREFVGVWNSFSDAMAFVTSEGAWKFEVVASPMN